MFITGPEVIKTVLGEEISMEDLGGARVQTEISGNAHFYAATEQECFEQIKKLVTFIPWNNKKKADSVPGRGRRRPGFDLEKIIPADPRQPYDVRDVIRAICDDSDFFEVQEHWAANIVIGFARLERADRRHRGQPAAGAGRRARRRLLGQGGAVHPLLRRLQHPARHLRRPARATSRASTRSTPG